MKPIVKWVGGKSKLLDLIIREINSVNYENYYEPFAGGCSVVLRVLSESSDKKTFISDINNGLVNLYNMVRNHVDLLIEELSKSKYSNDSLNYYINRKRFNEIKQNCTIESAALFIYLNKCCYNGMYRENSKGEFNIPFGKMKNPLICDKTSLSNFREFLINSTVSCHSYDCISPSSGDLVYMDPPYHKTFTGYNKTSFGEDEQVRLKKFIDELTAKDVYVILSNSDTEFIRDLYNKYTIIEISASCLIGGKNSSRGTRKELLIKNF